MTATTTKLILLLFFLGLISTGCANQGTEQAKYPDETDFKNKTQKLKVKAPEISRDNYHAFLDSY